MKLANRVKQGLIIPGNVLPDPHVLELPSVSLNVALSGGIETNCINCFWGNYGSGKSTIAFTTIGMAQKLGYTPIIFDTENAVSERWVEACGIAPGSFYYRKTAIVEEIVEITREILEEKPGKYIILIDSVSGVLFESSLEAGKQTAMHAVAQKWLTIRLNALLNEHIALIYVAQQSTHGIGGSMAFMDANLGEGAKHLSGNLVKLFTSLADGNIKRDPETQRIVSQKVQWIVQKTRQNGATGTKGEYWFNKDNAEFDRKQELVTLGKRFNIITGNTWLYYGEKRGQGVDNLVKVLDDVDYKTIEDTLMSMASVGGDYFEREEIVEDGRSEAGSE